MSTHNKAFEKWWAEDGRMYDPDTEDVPWFDKRKELAELAFVKGVESGMLHSKDNNTRKYISVSKFQHLNSTEMKALKQPLLVIDKQENPIAVIVPYDLYLQLQELCGLDNPFSELISK